MLAYVTHWCYTCQWFVIIDGDVFCPLCNGSFIQDLNELDEQWGPLYEGIQLIMELTRMDDTIDSVVSQVEDDQIDHSNRPALPSDSSNSINDSLQTIRITQRHVQDDLNCAICLDQFQLGHEVRETPCKHLYHYSCIVLWLVRRNSCPICRCDILPQSTWC